MKKLLDYFLKSKKESASASTAKERLQIIVSHERAKQNSPEFISKLQQELVNVIAKYVHIDPEQVKVDLGQTENCSVLELNITLPNLDTTEVKTSVEEPA